MKTVSTFQTWWKCKKETDETRFKEIAKTFYGFYRTQLNHFVNSGLVHADALRFTLFELCSFGVKSFTKRWQFESFPLLRCYAAYVGSQLSTFRNKYWPHLQGSSSILGLLCSCRWKFNRFKLLYDRYNDILNEGFKLGNCMSSAECTANYYDNLYSW
jgi:hypothetical protein